MDDKMFLGEIYSKRWEVEFSKNMWRVLVKLFFGKFISPEDTVLDIGCGFGFFINAIDAREKIALDANEAVKSHLNNDVKFIHVSNLSLDEIEDCSVDVVFMSNFLEHLNNGAEVIELLHRLRRILKPGGKIMILQPNFRLVGVRYFDFIDHKTILTDKSLEEVFSITGYRIHKRILRFLPYTAKSRIPKNLFLIKLYLIMRPLWFLMGKQSFYIISK